jgi:hypothetical protein
MPVSELDLVISTLLLLQVLHFRIKLVVSNAA